MNYENAVWGFGVTLPDIIGQHGEECPRFVPLRAHCQKTHRLYHYQDVTIFVKDADICWKAIIAGT
jgi:hypothetical protein